MNPYEIRQEATRIIGEDRVPVDVLEDIVERFGPIDAAVTVREVTETIARTYGVDVRLIEEDHNGAPEGTANYDGRALAFSFDVDGRDIRVLVEDVTVDE